LCKEDRQGRKNLKMKTVYFSDYTNYSFLNKEDCEKHEEEYKKRIENWKKNTSESKLDKLIFDLNNSVITLPGTIATCSAECLAIKHMVQVCQKFAEENKQYLSYY